MLGDEMTSQRVMCHGGFVCLSHVVFVCLCVCVFVCLCAGPCSRCSARKGHDLVVRHWSVIWTDAVTTSVSCVVTSTPARTLHCHRHLCLLLIVAEYSPARWSWEIRKMDVYMFL